MVKLVICGGIQMLDQNCSDMGQVLEVLQTTIAYVIELARLTSPLQ